MIIYLIHKTDGTWLSGSSKEVLTHLSQLFNWQNLHYSLNQKPLIDQEFISLSHTGSLMAIAYHHHAIGIDIESPRHISLALINRLHLNPDTPLESWCLKEACIKLMDDKHYLYKELPNNLYHKALDIDGYIGQITSLFPIDQINYIELNESDLI